MSKSNNQPLMQFLEKWATKTESESSSSLPSINNKSGERCKKVKRAVPRRCPKIDFVRRNKQALSPVANNSNRRVSELKHSKTIANLAPTTKTKRNSAKIDYQPLSEQEVMQCEFTHAYMITKSKMIVDKAKAMRFSGFFSPRVLRSKANNIGTHSDTQMINIRAMFDPSHKQSTPLIEKAKINQIIRNKIESDKVVVRPRPRFLSPDCPIRESAEEVPCNILPSRFQFLRIE